MRKFSPNFPGFKLHPHISMNKSFPQLCSSWSNVLQVIIACRSKQRMSRPRGEIWNKKDVPVHTLL